MYSTSECNQRVDPSSPIRFVCGMSAHEHLCAEVAANETVASTAVYERAAKRRIQEFVLFSKPLFTAAFKFAQARGRGAYLQIWASLAEADDMSSARPALHYIPFEMVQKLGYAPACELTKCHDVFSMFVVIVAVQTNDERDSIMSASLLPASVSDTVLPALETTFALQRMSLGDHAHEDNAAPDSTTIPFTALLCPTAPSMHAALCSSTGAASACVYALDSDAQGGGGGGGSGDDTFFVSSFAARVAAASASFPAAAAHSPRITLASLFGDVSASPHSLAAGLSVAAAGEPPLVLSLISTACAQPTCNRVYNLPLVSLDASVSKTSGHRVSDDQHVGPKSDLSLATSVPADDAPTASTVAAAVAAGASASADDDCPFFPVSNSAIDKRSICAQCFLQTYCSAECQRQHWRASHRVTCHRVRASFMAQYLHIHESLSSTAPNQQTKKKKKKLLAL